MRTTSYIVLALLLLSGCKKYEPMIPEGNESIFFATWTAGSITATQKVDESTSAFSALRKDSLGVTYYEGGFIGMNDIQDFNFQWRADDANSPDIDQTTNATMPDFRNVDPVSGGVEIYDVRLNAELIGNIESIEWTVLGETYSEKEITVTVSSEEGITSFPVTINAVYTNGCSANLKDTVYLPNHGCDCQIKSSLDGGLVGRFEAKHPDNRAYEYDWQFSGGATASSQFAQIQYDVAAPDRVDEVLLRIQSGDCVAWRKHNRYFPGVPSACTVNFSYEIETKKDNSNSNLDLGTIALNLRIDGVEYSSGLGAQPEWAYFEVESTSNYVDAYNSSDSRSIQIEANFECLVWPIDASSGLGDPIRLTNGSMMIPIGMGAN